TARDCPYTRRATGLAKGNRDAPTNALLAASHDLIVDPQKLGYNWGDLLNQVSLSHLFVEAFRIINHLFSDFTASSEDIRKRGFFM
ncbi:MAG: hypothetical protein ACPGWR_26260, partial [Ardenticatenaceae bacterium]